MNIVVAFSRPEDGRNIRNILMKNGMQVTVSGTSGSQVLSYADDLRSGVVVSGFRFGDMTCRQLCDQLPEEFDVLLIASPSKWSGEDMGRIRCLPAPVKVCDLISAVRELKQQQIKRRRQRLRRPQERGEEDQRVLEEAKQCLMAQNKMSEPEAHRYLQKCSMDSGTGLAEAARMVLRLYQE